MGRVGVKPFLPVIPGLRGSRSARTEPPPSPTVSVRQERLERTGSVQKQIGIVPTRILDPNPKRAYLMVQNNSNIAVRVGFDAGISLSRGIVVYPNGGNQEFTSANLVSGEVWAVALIPVTLDVMEGLVT